MPRRAQPGLLFLLMAAVVVVAAVTGTVDSSGAPAACAPPCPVASSRSSPTTIDSTKKIQEAQKQCLHYLQKSHQNEVCARDLSVKRRRAALNDLRLRHCCEHRVVEAVPDYALRDASTCRQHLQELLEADYMALEGSIAHNELLMRYDCAQNYSIAFTCDQCKVAYRRWVCSELVPFYGSTVVSSGVGAEKTRNRRIPPCLRLCEDVEQQCPYLLPDQTLTPSEAAHPTPQYAGEPNFFCQDPHIPRLFDRSNGTGTGDEDCCYTHCGTPGRGGAQPSFYCEKPCPAQTAAPVLSSDVSAAADAASSGHQRTLNWWTLLLLMTLLTRILDSIKFTCCVRTLFDGQCQCC